MARRKCTGSGSRDRCPGKNICLCRDGVSKAKAQLELNLARDAKSKKRSSTDMSARKGRSKEVHFP